MAFKKQLVTSCKQAIWGEILGGNAPNYASFNMTPTRIPNTRIRPTTFKLEIFSLIRYRNGISIYRWLTPNRL